MEAAGVTDDRIEELSATYLEEVTECVSALDGVFDGGTPGVERVESLESQCDEIGRALRSALGATAPTFRGVYLQAGDLAEFYTRADDVANHAEGVALDYRATGAYLGLVRPHLREMVADAVVASAHLETATAAYLGDEGDDAVSEAVARIRELERACDDRRHDAVRVAFEQRDAADALVLRELVRGVDAVVDAIEDAADHIEFMLSLSP
ncbi:DUF47 domain-containing protein [Salarchaeum sp. JOR-1]|uniref:DUF47 domain-containing protein n=1 Tax=Salarchaeum sp. JOR-1 TaxID=2599399 RepID=UPI0011988F90|nr:DUF47 family protein [Salarchaeum sp. JOR-1]QDX41259.1 DUF47 family protein [Salarchaeum sp. JOR-1]